MSVHGQSASVQLLVAEFAGERESQLAYIGVIHKYSVPSLVLALCVSFYFKNESLHFAITMHIESGALSMECMVKARCWRAMSPLGLSPGFPALA